MNKIPNHLAIIPDGNRRWAKRKSLTPWAGHRYSVDNLKKIFDEVIEIGIPYFSFWASSQDNLKKRTKREVNILLNSFKKEFTKLTIDKRIHQYQVKINILGEWREQFPKNVKEPMEKAIAVTKDYNKFHLNFLIAYSGIDEMIKAIRSIARQDVGNPGSKITPDFIKQYLFTKDLPPVDFLIRTGGEPHMSSGFMMWDIADSQMYFSNKFWPEFTGYDLRLAIKEYAHRSRRFGR